MRRSIAIALFTVLTTIGLTQCQSPSHSTTTGSPASKTHAVLLRHSARLRPSLLSWRLPDVLPSLHPAVLVSTAPSAGSSSPSATAAAAPSAPPVTSTSMTTTPTPPPALVATPTPSASTTSTVDPVVSTGGWTYEAATRVAVCEEGGWIGSAGPAYPDSLGISAANWSANGGGSDVSPAAQIAVAARIQPYPPDRDGCAAW